MMDEFDELEKLAKAATPGPWVSTKYGYEKYSINGPKGVEVCGTPRENNAAFIAAANPQRILALIALIALARKGSKPIEGGERRDVLETLTTIANQKLPEEFQSDILGEPNWCEGYTEIVKLARATRVRVSRAHLSESLKPEELEKP